MSERYHVRTFRTHGKDTCKRAFRMRRDGWCDDAICAHLCTTRQDKRTADAMCRAWVEYEATQPHMMCMED